MSRLPREVNRNTELKLIENERERAVSLSKRRNDLFKKANELATLCGVKIAILLFSITGKPISFGSPNIQSVVNRFLNSDQVDQQQDDTDTRSINFYRESTNPELNNELNKVIERLADVKKEGQMLDEILKRPYGGKTHKEYVRSLGYDELMQLKGKNEELKRICVEASRLSSSNEEHDAIYSKIGGPKKYLKM
ncbi:agamous-like MADS-box protein AGL62 [Cynara cardunculus var. scolymus]|uniref:Transcription factor, MADS-box n=1 Tax=Cynara cardunculus var. scolymus TaxID=59895 RepID=A0A118JYH5_CYNCS|nr:agamous-like MADS-box protein AGL62 [Cynara cardunculus var. scolymus]KVH98636.1 Transcription factor, MADS-box [Cynara cardunculus var. scolymus]